jgi:hypothetical protein
MNMRNHEQTMPVVQDAILIYQHGGQDEQLQVGTPAWYAWLNTARTFAFRSALGTFTARKEQASNKRGAGTGAPTASATARSTEAISANRRS